MTRRPSARGPRTRSLAESVVRIGASIAVAGTVNAVINVRTLRRRATPRRVDEPVRVLVPARDEERHVETTVRSLLAQEDLPDLRVVVLDDGSTDTTAAILAGIDDDRLTVVSAPDVDPPAGWLGKPWACQRLADAVDAEGDDASGVLVFADADVAFAPRALSTAVAELRDGAYAMVSPFPREVAVTPLERVVQPLLNWVWLTPMPVWLARRTTWVPLSVANGQFLVLDADAYRSVGGHASVRGAVIEDVALTRELRRAGLRATPTLGADLASCRMYHDHRELVDGYTKSFWNLFGGRIGSTAMIGMLTISYVLPPLAMLHRRTRVAGAVGTAAGIVSRVVVARATGERVGDAVLHPLSIATFAWLNGLSWRRHVRGRNQWKGRSVVPG